MSLTEALGDTDRQGRSVISLFSGAMGLDLGLESAGLDIVVALECKSFPVATIARNRPSLPLIDRPIEDASSEEILKAAQLAPREAFAVVGGPSCQAFSTAGRRKSLGDPRGTMFQHFVRVVRDTQPEFFVMENVRGLLSAAVRHRPLRQRGPGYPRLGKEELLGSAFRVVAETLRNLGYYCVFDVLDAADYGVPQTRQRLVIIGSRDGRRVRMPEPTHDSEGARGLARWRTLGEALGGPERGRPGVLPVLPCGGALPEACSGGRQLAPVAGATQERRPRRGFPVLGRALRLLPSPVSGTPMPGAHDTTGQQGHDVVPPDGAAAAHRRRVRTDTTVPGRLGLRGFCAEEVRTGRQRSTHRPG